LKILLINPWIYDVASYDYWLKPLGLLMLARKLQESGHELKLVDCLDRYDPELEKITGKKIKSKWNGTGKFEDIIVKKPQSLSHIPRYFKRYGLPMALFKKKLLTLKSENWIPDYIFVTSAMTYWYPGSFEAIKISKEFFPDSKTMLGGNYANLLPEHSKKSGADIVCNESKMERVINFLRENGIHIKEGLENNLNLIPLYDLYMHCTSHLVFLTSLGCPYRCTYCATPFLQKFTQEDPIKVVDAVEKYTQMFAVKNVAFFDDAILINHEKHFDVVLKEIIKRKLPEKGIILHIPNGIHAKLLVEDTAWLMKRANVGTIKVALETIDPVLQKETGAKLTNQDFYNAVDLLKKVGFTRKEISAFVLVNLPGQTFDSVLKVHDICKKLDVFPEINEYTPIPGTKDFEKVFGTSKLPDNFDPLQLNNTILSFSWKDGFSSDEIELIKSYNKKTVFEMRSAEGGER
jgi:radical SAM superfamily enzyme YgiQ (UPF0313 family)